MPKEAKSSGTDQKLNKLLERLKSYGKVIVAFSGGVDSTLLAEAANRALGSNAIAVTAISDSYPEREMKAAQEIAKQIGIRLERYTPKNLRWKGIQIIPRTAAISVRPSCSTSSAPSPKISDWHHCLRCNSR